MILIVDSGSTKADWMSVNSKENRLLGKIQTKGLNPAILNEKELQEIILSNPGLISHVSDVTHIFFYGAGCGTNKPKHLLKHVLETIFTHAKVEVQEDTVAAVRAAINHENEAAIVCILGTGCSCSYFDGKNLHQRIESLGYTIMDDAAGNYYGKQLLRDYYLHHMPEALKISFSKKYDLDADTVKFNLYKQPNPNAYLASFAEFMFLHKNSVYVKILIKQGLHAFYKNMILQFSEEIKTVPVHFVGSIAHFTREEIFEVAEEFHFKVGNIVRRPIDGLLTYHINKLHSWK